MVINFYKFLEMTDLSQLRESHLAFCRSHHLLGTILFAQEGINAGLSGSPEAVESYLRFLRQDPRFADVVVKTTHGVTSPYRKLHVRIKPSIVTFSREDDPSPTAINSAPRLSPAEFKNLLISKRADVVLVDTRNRYETEWGSFAGAETLEIDKFSDFPAAFITQFKDAKDKTFLFYCTGGIRCEKAVPWAIQQGFERTYQLDGGIVKYLEEFGSGDGEFEGSCFVFDNRWALDPVLQEVDDPSPDREVTQEKPLQFRVSLPPRTPQIS